MSVPTMLQPDPTVAEDPTLYHTLIGPLSVGFLLMIWIVDPEVRTIVSSILNTQKALGLFCASRVSVIPDDIVNE